jgi:ADP-ribose pyrophosphatase YjhB (NUDIX family)
VAGREYPERPLVGVGVVVWRGDAVLMVRRAKAPLLGALSFPGGGQRLGETVEGCARRELMEETGVEVGVLRIAAYADVIDRAEHGAVRFHYTVLDLVGDWVSGEPLAGGDVSEALFLTVSELEPAGIDAAHLAVVMRSKGWPSAGSGAAPLALIAAAPLLR